MCKQKVRLYSGVLFVLAHFWMLRLVWILLIDDKQK